MATPTAYPHYQVTYSPWSPVQLLQVIQGGYYILTGLLVALAVVFLQGPADHPRAGSELWPVRIIALIVAGFGVAMVWSGLRKGSHFIPSGVGLVVALILLAQTAAAMALGRLPLTFLLDAGLEGLFAVWWVVTMLAQTGGTSNTSTPASS
jgi:hypothetical protein